MDSFAAIESCRSVGELIEEEHIFDLGIEWLDQVLYVEKIRKK